MSLTKDERLNLKNMMGEMDYQDNTDMIRRVKHSVKIRNNIRRMEDLKREHVILRQQSPEQFFNIVYAECKFLYDNYMDIFTRVMKDELDIGIMSKLLIVLKLIEDGQNNSVKLFNAIKAFELPFYQLIWEFGTDNQPQWVHVAYRENDKKGQILKAYKSEGKTKYLAL